MLERIKLLFKELFSLSLFKTLYFNFHYFGLRGFSFPVLVGRKFKLKKMKGTVIIPDHMEHKIFLGRNDYGRMTNHGYWINSGTVQFLGNCHIGNGTTISVKKDAHLTLGNNLFIGGNDLISCDTAITIGSDCALAWNVTIMDDDSHRILDSTGAVINLPCPISIADHVWIGFDVRIFKGASIPKHCVVAAGSTITKEFHEEHLLLGSINTILKENINWKP